MATQILYGVGNSILKDFIDPTKVIALSKLKNVSVEASATDEKLYGGDNPYPLAVFPKEKAIKVSAENATFSMKVLGATQGVDIKTGSVVMTEAVSINIPEDGVVMLDYEATDGTIIIDGFTKGTTTATTGQYIVDGTDKKKLTFAVADAGKEIDIVYDRTSASTAETLEMLKNSIAKPFKFIHRIPVYDDNNNIVAQGQLVVYKAKANNAFSFNLQPQTAFAPKIELEALDPKRPDGKLWDFTLEPVTAQA
jgi:hypothetical protein